MQRILAITAAVLLSFSGPALAQNATPVLIGQGGPQVGGQGGTAADGQGALAQVPDQQDGLFGPGGPSPLLIAGGLALGVGGLIAIIVSQNKSDNPVSP